MSVPPVCLSHVDFSSANTKAEHRAVKPIGLAGVESFGGAKKRETLLAKGAGGGEGMRQAVRSRNSLFDAKDLVAVFPFPFFPPNLDYLTYLTNLPHPPSHRSFPLPHAPKHE